MESLLQQIVRTSDDIAIIDITGVPTVDTLVAQHLLKTVAAARLMGAECIISGIRPQIAHHRSSGRGTGRRESLRRPCRCVRDRPAPHQPMTIGQGPDPQCPE